MNLYFIGGLFIINGHMDVGILLVFMNDFNRFLGNISTITDTMLSLKNEEPGLERIMEIMTEKEQKKRNRKFSNRSVSVRNVSFRYENAVQPVLKEVSLTVDSGEHVAIVGRSRCGKTALLKLLMGLHSSPLRCLT